MGNRSIRGAITVENNNGEDILRAAEELLLEIIHRNNLEAWRVISILFTVTQDLTQANPAVAARKLGITRAALMCAQEMFVDDGMERCIRLQMDVDADIPQSDMRHIYLGRARSLRPDLATEDSDEHKTACAIAIDGPSGAGKSTIAKLVAERLGFVYVDTGAMYRAVALYCLNNGVPLDNKEAVEETLSYVNISIKHIDGEQHVILNDEDITDAIRGSDVADGASKVAVCARVREKLVKLQRQLAERDNVVMDGRDIGTHVLPDATLKIFLDATVSERARRRMDELKYRGFEPDFDTVYRDIADRDIRDTDRDVSPLRRAEGALVVDSSSMTPEEVAAAIGDAFSRR